MYSFSTFKTSVLKIKIFIYIYIYIYNFYCTMWGGYIVAFTNILTM
jgi:hypothetical protein